MLLLHRVQQMVVQVSLLLTCVFDTYRVLCLHCGPQVEKDHLGVDRYFFDSYFRKVEESSNKTLKLSGKRALKMPEYGQLESRLDVLGKGFGPKASNSNQSRRLSNQAITQATNSCSEHG